MKKFFIILFAGVLLSTGVAYAATTSQEALLAQMIGMLQSLGDSLAAIITNMKSVNPTGVAGSTTSVVGSVGADELEPYCHGACGSGTKCCHGECVPLAMACPVGGIAGNQVINSAIGNGETLLKDSLSVSKPNPVVGSPFRITNPNGVGDVAWIVDNTYIVEWDTTPTMGAVSNSDYVDILLLTDVSKTPIWKLDVAMKNTGKIKWTIPAKNIYPGIYRIGVQSFANPLTRAISESFTIVGKDAVSVGGVSNNPILTSWSITSPVANGSWKIGTSQYIKWTSTGSYKYATIQLVNTKTNKETVVSTMALNNGSKLWKVTASAGIYKIKIYPYGNPGKAVMSGEFTIATVSPGVPPQLQSLQGWKLASEFPTPRQTSTVQPKTFGEEGDEWLRCCTKWIPGYGYWRCCGHGSFCGDCGGGSINWQWN